MGEILSTIKPPRINPKPDAATTIKWNDKSYESYVNTGFADYVPHSVSAPRDRIQRFLTAVDIRKGPIERNVNLMIRLKAPDWNSKKNERKEYLIYEETWNAFNWLNVPIDPVSDHWEGIY